MFPRSLPMIYLIPAATAAMLGYMLWSTVFRLRHDRVRTERDLTRGKFAFRARERVRLLLSRSFRIADDKAEWEDPLLSTLDRVTAKGAAREARTAQKTDAVS